jgi:hypothetical protein
MDDAQDRRPVPNAAQVHRRLIDAYPDVLAGRLDEPLTLIDADVIDHRGGTSGDHHGRQVWRHTWEQANRTPLRSRRDGHDHGAGRAGDRALGVAGHGGDARPVGVGVRGDRRVARRRTTWSIGVCWHHGAVTENDIIRFVSDLPGVAVMRAGEADGAPEIAWGDTFVFYDPNADLPPDRKLPFATIVTKDYPGFDTASDLNRPGVFRINIAVSRRIYQDLIGHSPAAFPEHRASYDYSALDTVVPHPVYATQGWVCVLNPGAATEAQVRVLLTEAHARAAARHGRAGSAHARQPG